MVYIANWVIICYLPPIKGTRKLHGTNSICTRFLLEWNHSEAKGLGMKNSRKCCRDIGMPSFPAFRKNMGWKRWNFSDCFWETHHVFLMLEIAVLNPNPPEHQSQNPPNLDHLVTTMGLDIFGTLENTNVSFQSSFQPLEPWFLTEGNEKEGLTDGRGFGGKTMGDALNNYSRVVWYMLEYFFFNNFFWNNFGSRGYGGGIPPPSES